MFAFSLIDHSRIVHRRRSFRSSKKNAASSIRTSANIAIAFSSKGEYGDNKQDSRRKREGEEARKKDIYWRISLGEFASTSLGSPQPKKSRGRHFKSPLLLQHCTRITYAHTSLRATHTHTRHIPRTTHTETYTRMCARWLVGLA